MAVTESHPIPVSDEFPVHWADPADAQLFWIRDVAHQPYAITPLNTTLIQTGFSEGASRAISRLSMPVDQIRNAAYNGYVYLALHPVQGTPAELAARFQEMKRITMELGATVLQDWRETFEPQVLAHCDAILAHDYDTPSTAEVARYVGGFYDIAVDLWDIHMRVNIPPMNAVFGLEEFVGEVVGPAAVEQSRLLLQGFDNKSIETGRAFWDLRRWVREDQGFTALLNQAGTVDGQVSVDEHPRTAEFRERWQAFLDTYGWRSDKFLEIGHPSWREDQTTPLAQLKGFLAKPDSDDPYEAHRRQAAERDQLVAEMEKQLPAEAVPQFRGLLALAQQYIPIAEDHNFTLDQKAHAVLRYGIQQLGRRLVRDGILQDAEDVFYLTLDEIRAIGDGDAGAGLASKTEERRALHREQEQLKPPLEIGTPPPPDAPPDPILTKFFGYGVESSTEVNLVKGLACSRGTVSGVAKVVVTLDQAGKLEAGDILVCPMTMPAWTPLFAVVAAVVADAGGPLSHCAIVAREYGIPCVAGTKNGTEVIRDGMRLRVDGGAGTVEILG